jgi:hypothetical protein
MSPEKLPIGELKRCPLFSICALRIKKWNSKCDSVTRKNKMTPLVPRQEVEQKIKIYFENKFPYRIVKFEESYPDGF